MDKKQIIRLQNLQKKFENIYGNGRVYFAMAPARINIIGEHIDYIEYFKTAVLPFGSKEYNMLMAFRPRNDYKVRCASLNKGFKKHEFSIKEFKVPNYSNYSDRWRKYLAQLDPLKPFWTNYIKASVFFAKNLFLKKNIKGMDVLVDSTIPIAGGASSSSALVVCSALAIRKANNIKINLDEIAESSSKAEWFCGTRGGKMDHASVCFSKERKALLINFSPFAVKRISMAPGYSWVTFYTTPADKGKELTAEYNERSVVSRFIIPMFLKRAGDKKWKDIKKSIKQRNIPFDKKALKKVLSVLPKKITLREFEKEFKNSFEEIKTMYPVLIKQRGLDFALEIRSRAKHHFGEIERVIKAAKFLETAHKQHIKKDIKAEADIMKNIGKLLNETHKSLRDFYGVSAKDLERVVNISLSVKGVLGARVMGGGFGGNVLVLVKSENAQNLIKTIKQKYYFPRARKDCDKDIMVSTSGNSARLFADETDIQIKLAEKVNNWLNWKEKEIFSLAKKISIPKKPIKPLIIAAGKGTRAKKSGLLIPKVLALLKGKPSLIRVLEKFNYSKPIVVVSPNNRLKIKKALSKYSVDFVVQKNALGTADAVFRAIKKLKNYKGDIAVIWGKQALVRKETIKKTIILHQRLGAAMSFPTTKRKNPYAPLSRDKNKWVEDSVETHLESARKISFGEDNVGFFVLDFNVLSNVLQELYDEYYILSKQKYNTPKGELGFPNLMTRKLRANGNPVFAFCFAKEFEAIGINEKKDIANMERYL